MPESGSVHQRSETMKEKRSYTYRIEPRDSDYTRHATLCGLTEYILHVAGEDADRNGFGVRDLNRMNASWVLIRMGIEIERMPREYEQIRITTWVSKVTRAMTTRNFEVIDASGAIICRCVTNWAMIELTERRIMDLNLLSGGSSMTEDYEMPIRMPARLAKPHEEHHAGHKVSYSDLDFNCHANSAKYLEWAVDTYPLETVCDKGFRRVDINFLHETRYGEDIEIVWEGEENRLFEMRNGHGEVVCRLCFDTGQCIAEM